MQEKKGALKVIDDTILELTKDEDIDKEIIEASEIGELINRSCVEISNALSSVNNIATLSSSNSVSVRTSSSINTPNPTIKAKLPKLTLRKFSEILNHGSPFGTFLQL